MTRMTRVIAVIVAATVVATPAVAAIKYAERAGFAKEAGTANRLNGVRADQFVRKCLAGSLIGQAWVPADLVPEWTEVRGWTFKEGASGCEREEVLARHVDVGTYQVRFGDDPLECEPNLPAHKPAVLVTPYGVSGLTFGYELVCLDDGMTAVEIVLEATGGVRSDASFALAELAIESNLLTSKN